MSVYSNRMNANRVGMVLAVGAAFVGLFFLAAILWTLLWQGVSSISLDIFVLDTPPPPGDGGGLRNAIVGSLLMTLLAIAVATPIGILAGTYLSEYSGNSRLGEVAKFINDVLLSAPSIIVGLFIYTAMVLTVGHFSALAGAASLALIALPVINRTTQDMLGLVPNALREASAALGAPRWKTMTFVIYRSARSGIVTGVLLAIARISGETAPLLFTALNNQFFSTDLSQPMANLPTVIFQFALSPYEGWQRLAWGGALIVTAAILLLNIVARSLSSGRKSSQ